MNRPNPYREAHHHTPLTTPSFPIPRPALHYPSPDVRLPRPQRPPAERLSSFFNVPSFHLPILEPIILLACRAVAVTYKGTCARTQRNCERGLSTRLGLSRQLRRRRYGHRLSRHARRDTLALRTPRVSRARILTRRTRNDLTSAEVPIPTTTPRIRHTARDD